MVWIKVEPRANGPGLLKVWAGFAEFPERRPLADVAATSSEVPLRVLPAQPLHSCIWVVGMEGLFRAYQSSSRSELRQR